MPSLKLECDGENEECNKVEVENSVKIKIKEETLGKTGDERKVKKNTSQPTLSVLFDKMAKKRKAEPDTNNIKKLKQDLNGNKSKTISISNKCTECRQMLDSSDLKLFPGDPEEALEEFIMLTDPKLSVHTDGEYENDDVNERPQHKITNFCVYDRNTHICAFDSGLVEKNIELYFSGVVKPIYEEDPNITGGVFARNLGPIIEWWVSGYDGGQQALIGFGTAFAEYVLMSPSELYVPYMNAVKEKIYISKAVIELLTDDNEASYEDLMNRLHTTVPPQGLASFSEESLLRHAQFVVDQVQSFDSAADDTDPILITSPCMRALIGLSGVTLGGKRSIRAPNRSRLPKVKKDVHSLAATTPLVRSIFENFFTEQLEKDLSKINAPRRKRCGICEACQLPDCGKCSFCRNMVKFGGTGTSKQACAQRRCPNMAVQEADEDDILNDILEDEMDKKALSCKSTVVRKAKKQKVEIEWVGEPCKKDSSRVYYDAASINDFTVKCGDFVLVSPSDPTIPMYIGKIISMWETSSGKYYYHLLWFHRGSDTVLGETSSPAEVFGTFECDEEDMMSIYKKCKVTYKAPKENWFSLGGTEESVEDVDSLYGDDGQSFFYQKWYDSETCRFEDPPAFHEKGLNDCAECIACRKQSDNEKIKCVELEILEEEADRTYFKAGIWLGSEIRVGDCVYIKPEAYDFDYEKEDEERYATLKEVDEEKYPEAYRKSDYVKGSNLDAPKPFKIGYITKIYQSNKKSAMPKVVVKKFYRPEDTHRNSSFNYQLDLNLLYWSDEEVAIEFSKIEGKCYVVYGGNLIETPEEYARKGPHRFYFNEAYVSSTEAFEEPPTIAQRIGRIGKGKGKKSKPTAEMPKGFEECTYPVIQNKLKTLDVFAGCGGLSEGFHQAGISETLWAIEKEESAAQAFRLNFPNCSVFSEDCNFLLRLVMDEKEKSFKGQKLPQKGDVEMLCGGPPCQGFSGMNRFNSRQYSLFKNSLIVSYLSYCDYYRPKFFLLENVRNFVSFKRNMILKLTLACLIRMGYQCTFGVLQAGNYGVPQTRRRAIILAAAPGEKLPFYPEPLHVFSSRACQLSVVVDEKKYDSNIKWTASAPYRTITVRDSMSDLPQIKNGARSEEISYSGDPISYYQKMIRGNSYQPMLRDHICKEMSPLVEARMKHIPLIPGSDWRDLPNIVLRLSDGSHTNKLQYTHNDVKNGKAKNGALRGVCLCATGKSCDPMDRQFNTVIPWCLPHTGNRHNHWAGLYGRLEWDGFFSTTITNPEPMGKQGRVLHPEQHRVVSVRECARSQGFPDSYRFYGNILDRHRQIGNAVPPPLSAAIGLEIKKCIAVKESENGTCNEIKIELPVPDVSASSSS